MVWYAVFAVAVVLVVLGLFRVLGPVRASWREHALTRAQKEFHLRREALEIKFLQIAAATGKPRGLSWADCEFENDVTYARNRRTGIISAFVEVTIRFEAVEDSPLLESDSLEHLRAATAVFQYHKKGWQTEGRAVFNLKPVEAIAHYHNDYEMVAQELTRRTTKL